jgi:iron(III) transport system substrate-binding protein
MVERLCIGMVLVFLGLACAPAAPGPTAPAKPADAAGQAKAVPTPAAPQAAGAQAAKPAAAQPAKPAGPEAVKPAAPSSTVVPAPDAAKPGVSFQALVQAAREEAGRGKVSIMVSSPKGEAPQRQIVEEFQKRYNIKMEWEWLPLNSNTAGPRIVQEAKAGQTLPSVMGGFSPQNYIEFIDRNGLSEKVDWVGTFESTFPTIKEVAVDRIVPDLRGKILAQWDVAYVMMFNTDLIKAADVPGTLEELADPKWRGKFILNGRGGAPFDTIALQTGEEKVLDLITKLAANDPRLKESSPAVVGGVTAGESPLGVGYISLIEAERAKGAPVDWKPLPYIPVLPLNVFMVKGSPHPNLGKLFAAWLVTEGSQLQEQGEFLSRVTDPTSQVAKKIKELAPNAPLVVGNSAQEIELIEKTGARVIEILTRAAR